MKKLTLDESNLEVSSFCLGCMPFGARVSGDDVDALCDRFRDAGGNFFDTAHCYCFWVKGSEAGDSERELGRYVKARDCRGEVVIATKGAHPPVEGYRDDADYMSRRRIAKDIDESLQRMGIDEIDLFWLHRDDPRLPAGEIVEMLNEEVERGRIRAFGGSNWTAERLDEGNRYAAQHGVQGFAASQPRWSLLAYEPQSDEKRLEPGVLVTVNDADRTRHARSQLPLIPYGPTGNGFFAMEGRKPERWRNDENLARAKRARKLADTLGATPNQVALAWLTAQPFPVIPILGTADLDHLDDALAGANLRLSDEQRDRLEQG